AAPVAAGMVTGADGVGCAGVGMAAMGGALGRGTLGMATLGSGVGIAGRLAAGVGFAATRGTSDGVRNDADDCIPASGSKALGGAALGTPLPGVIRARHFPPSCAARTANAPSADV